MERMYVGSARKQKQPPKAGITRRELLRFIAIGLPVVLGVSKIEANLIPSPKVVPEEEVSFLKTSEDLELYLNGRIAKFKIPTVYVEYKGNVFQLYEIRANSDATHPLALIYGADWKHRPDAEIKPTLAHKAWDLFEILLHNRGKWLGMEEGEITRLRLRSPISSNIEIGESYNIPVKTPYRSLDEVLAIHYSPVDTRFI